MYTSLTINFLVKKKDFRKHFFFPRKYENHILKIILLYKKCRNLNSTKKENAETGKAFLNAGLGNLDWTSDL